MSISTVRADRSTHTFLPSCLQRILFRLLSFLKLSVVLSVVLLFLLRCLPVNPLAQPTPPSLTRRTFSGFSFPPCRLDMVDTLV